MLDCKYFFTDLSAGCPTDYSILGVLSEVNNTGQILQAAFDAFKFPTSDVVQFRALVTPCIPRCDPVRCDVTDYYGRSNNLKSFGKRKKRSSSSSEGEDNELMVAGVIHISDKFELEDSTKSKDQGDSDSNHGVIKNDGTDHFGGSSSSGEEVWTQQYNGDSCLNTASFAIGATIFLLAQCLLVGFWTYLYYKRKRQKEDEVNSSISEAVLQDQFHQRRQRTPVTATRHHRMAPASSSTDSGLADYDPYFVDPFDVPALGVVSFDDSGVMTTESVPAHRCHQGGIRFQKKQKQHLPHQRRRSGGHHNSSSSSSLEEEMSSTESSLSSLEPRNL